LAWASPQFLGLASSDLVLHVQQPLASRQLLVHKTEDGCVHQFVSQMTMCHIIIYSHHIKSDASLHFEMSYQSNQFHTQWSQRDNPFVTYPILPHRRHRERKQNQDMPMKHHSGEIEEGQYLLYHPIKSKNN
jgi:hypothetical protein